MGCSMAYDDLIRSINKACRILKVDLNDVLPSNIQEAVRLQKSLWQQVRNSRRR